jgi:hypothetical protein
VKVQNSVDAMLGALWRLYVSSDTSSITRAWSAYEIDDAIKIEEASLIIRCTWLQVTLEMSVVEWNTNTIQSKRGEELGIFLSEKVLQELQVSSRQQTNEDRGCYTRYVRSADLVEEEVVFFLPFRLC